MNLYSELPITLAISTRGAVSIESKTKMVGLSPFSARARRFALEYGAGLHNLHTSEDLSDLDTFNFTELAEALGIV